MTTRINEINAAAPVAAPSTGTREFPTIKAAPAAEPAPSPIVVDLLRAMNGVDSSYATLDARLDSLLEHRAASPDEWYGQMIQLQRDMGRLGFQLETLSRIVEGGARAVSDLGHLNL